MKRVIINIFCVILAFTLIFAFTGCESVAEPDEVDDSVELGDEEALAPDVSPDLMRQVREEGSVLYIYNWAEWWPPELFDNFSEEFGVEIIQDHFSSTDEMVTKFRLNPDVEYDLVSPGFQSFSQLKAIDVIQPLNHDWLPNVEEYLIEDYYDTWVNPNSEYGIMMNISYTGYVYNSDYVDEDDPKLGSWAIFFEGDDYDGRITMLSGMYETIGAALVYLGYDWFSVDEGELMEARDLLLETRDKLMAYDAWPSRLLTEEEALISQIWTGDSWYLHELQPALRVVLPEEGTDISPDIWAIPKGSQNPAAAHLFLNYVFRPDVNQMLIEWIGYTPTHKIVSENMPQEMLDWPGLMLTDDIRAIASWPTEEALFGEGRELRTQIWEELKN